jgi:16S rRNA (uracil1498-N3)-methyltransferase
MTKPPKSSTEIGVPANAEHSNKHEFAFYCDNLSALLAGMRGSELAIHDQALYHRLAHVVRLQPGDGLVLFDKRVHATCEIGAFVHKKSVTVCIVSHERNQQLSPHITCMLPVLKRADFEETISILAELGVNTIQLITTQKTGRAFDYKKEIERLERIMIAAAEQCKQFAMPTIVPPQNLPELCSAIHNPENTLRLYFDPTGTPLVTFLQQAQESRVSNIILMVGPEGDFTPEEKTLIAQAGFLPCKLTPTVLRAVHAVCVGVGAFRCLPVISQSKSESSF